MTTIEIIIIYDAARTTDPESVFSGRRTTVGGTVITTIIIIIFPAADYIL